MFVAWTKELLRPHLGSAPPLYAGSTGRKSTRPMVKILCLHGKGGCAASFRADLKPLMSAVPASVTWDFVDAPHVLGPASSRALSTQARRRARPLATTWALRGRRARSTTGERVKPPAETLACCRPSSGTPRWYVALHDWGVGRGVGLRSVSCATRRPPWVRPRRR